MNTREVGKPSLQSQIDFGTASPEGTVYAQCGKLYIQTSVGVLWQKTTRAEFNTGWVLVGSTASGLPDGGTEQQILVKQSADDGDADWQDNLQDYSHSGLVKNVIDDQWPLILKVSVDCFLHGFTAKTGDANGTTVTVSVNGVPVTGINAIAIDDTLTEVDTGGLAITAGSTITIQFSSTVEGCYNFAYTLEMTSVVPRSIGALPDQIYFGAVDVTVFDMPYRLKIATPGELAVLFSHLQKYPASALPTTETKFYCQNINSTVTTYIYFAYPDDWGDIDPAVGFKWALGNANSPTATVPKVSNFPSATSLMSFNFVSVEGGFQHPAGTIVDDGGWACYKRFVGQTLYRIYTFGEFYVFPTPNPLSVTPESRARASGVATLTHNSLENNGLGEGQYIIDISGAGGTGYNLSGVPATQTSANTFSYPSPGSPEGTTSDTGWSVNFYFILADSWAWDTGTQFEMPDPDVTLFIKGAT